MPTGFGPGLIVGVGGALLAAQPAVHATYRRAMRLELDFFEAVLAG